MGFPLGLVNANDAHRRIYRTVRVLPKKDLAAFVEFPAVNADMRGAVPRADPGRTQLPIGGYGAACQQVFEIIQIRPLQLVLVVTLPGKLPGIRPAVRVAAVDKDAFDGGADGGGDRRANLIHCGIKNRNQVAA